MRLLLTSSGITNPSIERALIDLLGKPISDSSALFIPTAIYPFPGGGHMAGQAIRGEAGGPLAGLDWKSVGVLELTALSSVDAEAWIPMVQESDALLVWGGDVLYLTHWMRESGLADLLPSLDKTVYVGVSAGSMATTRNIGETYIDLPRGSGEPMTTEQVTFDTPAGEVQRILVTADGLGLVDFSLIPHLGHEDHEDASMSNVERWAARIPAPTYAIDDDTAIVAAGGAVQVISEGHWRLFNE